MRVISAICLGLAIPGCTILGEDNDGDKTRDFGRGEKNLAELTAGIWVDPNGCDHWIIDDGVEGYLSSRLDRDGKPVCSGIAPPGYATGDFRSGDVLDPI